MTLIYPSHDHDIAALETRVLRRRHSYRQSRLVSQSFTRALSDARSMPALLRSLSSRHVLHLLVAASVPVAFGLTQIYQAPQPVAPLTLPAPNIWESSLPAAPLSLDNPDELPVPDSAFAEIDGLAEGAFRPDLLVSRPVPATISAETAKLRQGPGTNYDLAGDLAAGATLTLLERSGDWYKAQSSDGAIVWVMGELVNMNTTAASLLPESTSIPAPPPPKIATVNQPDLNLRDGPDTNYVGVSKLEADTQLDLLGRYGDWFQVQAPDGRTGWVKGEFLNMVPGVLERITVLSTIPDPHPALVGLVNTKGVNLREGPGTAYGKSVKLAANAQLDLLARYNDWFKVRTGDGTIGWVSDELLQVSDYVSRRVGIARQIPALPKPKPAAVVAPAPAPRAAPAQQAAPAPAPAPAAVVAPEPAAASGNVTEFAMQFVGSRYRWGGSSPGGFDCSGFVKYVYSQYGLKLPHSSSGQYSTAYGAIISDRGELRAGDIVFFVNTYKKGISHVGIYAGGGKVVQALSPGQGLGVASLNDGYWSEHYYSAIRPNL